MAKYLDANGVKYLWSKIKDNFWSKSDLDTTFVEVVDNLPTEGIKRCLYLKATAVESDNNKYEEYIYIGDLPISETNPYDATKWEKLGEYKAEVDLTPYAKKTELAWTKDGDSAVLGAECTVKNGSVAHGMGCTATGIYSCAQGGETQATEGYTHAEGMSTKATGNYAHAEGYSSTASGEAAHAEGGRSSAQGNCSHAEGTDTVASGSYSHAEGTDTVASGSYSHAEGRGTKTSGSYSHAEGRYNVDNAKALHSRGVGTDDTARKNSEYTYFNASNVSDTKNGNIYFLGVGGYDGMSTDATTYSSVQEVINNLQGSVLGSAEVDARDNRLDIALYDSNEEPNALAEVSLPMATATTLGVVKLADTSQGVSVDDKGVMTASDYVNAIVYSQVGSGVVTAEASDVNIALYGLAHKEGEKLCEFTLPAASATASGVMTAAMYAALPVEGALSNDEIDAAIA